MNLWHWLRGSLSTRYTSMRLYRRGMRRAKSHDHAAAIADYSQVIELPLAPPKIRAMALYNRALVHNSLHRDSEAFADLQSILEMEGAPAEVKTEAQRKLVRMARSSTRVTGIEKGEDGNSRSQTG